MNHISQRRDEKGAVLLVTLVVALLLMVMSVVMLELVWQESLSANAGKQAAVAHQVADAAGEIVIAWFHDPTTVPSVIAPLLEKRLIASDGTPTFFDHQGRSQFRGTPDHPDLVLDSSDPVYDRLLNDPAVGFFRSMAGLGVIRRLAIYAPSKPGLLCTVEVTVETTHPKPVQQSISMQLEALELPVLRSGIRAGGHLDLLSDDHFVSGVHWAPVVSGGNVVVRRMADIPILNSSASITGLSYGESTVIEDRWMQIWAGGLVQTIEPSPNGNPLPANVHQGQAPPGLPLERWEYEQLKQTAMRFGSYYALGADGLLYEDGGREAGSGVPPSQVFISRRVGDQRGLIFVDTLDRAAPRTDNLGTIYITSPYFEGVAVIQGHVRLRLSGGGNQLTVLSPRDNATARTTVNLTGIHFNGVLYVAGNIVVESPVKLYGAMVAEGHIQAPDGQGRLEVWHDDEMSWSLFRGVPIVYRAPGTWRVHY
ncbi:MAG: hypothetical protein NNA25_08900 [Nitrospira sp.]|nr:hypothetical protein [Nitrospira sp.]